MTLIALFLDLHHPKKHSFVMLILCLEWK